MDRRREKRNNSKRKQNQQNEEEFYDLDILDKGVNNNDELQLENLDQVKQTFANTNQKNNQEIEDLKNNKIKTKGISKITTGNKTLPTRKEITDIVVKNLTLFDLEMGGKTLNQIIDEKEKEIIKEIESNEIKAEEKNIENIIPYNIRQYSQIIENNKEDNKESIKNEGDEKEDSISVSEEDEETKKERALSIEKILRKTDELVNVPDFNIFDEKNMEIFNNKNE